jgi:hypothetical protein
MNNFYHVKKNDYDEVMNDEVMNDEVMNDEVMQEDISDVSSNCSDQINEERIKKNRQRNLTPPRKNRRHNSSFLGFKHIFMGVLISLIMMRFPNFSFSFCVTISINVIYKQLMFEMYIENSILRVCGNIIPFILLSNFLGASIATIVIYRKPILKSCIDVYI